MSFFQRLFSSNTSSPSALPEKPQLPSSSDSSLSPNSSSSNATPTQINTQLSSAPRTQQLQQPQNKALSTSASASASASAPTSAPAPLSTSPSLLSSLSPLQKQLSYLLTGVAFVGLSAFVTRRSIARRRISLIPRFYHYSHDPPPAPQISGAMEALEALNIATINVLSHTIFWTSGIVFAFDIRGTDDMRAKCKKAVGLEGVDIQKAEEEFEEWLKETFAGKEGEGEGSREQDRRRNEIEGGKRRRDGER